jgi:hypothetical protein
MPKEPVVSKGLPIVLPNCPKGVSGSLRMSGLPMANACCTSQCRPVQCAERGERDAWDTGRRSSSRRHEETVPCPQ